MDRPDVMRALTCVVETGSLTKTIQTLHTSKTMATQLIQQLGARLRVKLLRHTTRKFGMTPDDTVYYERVIRLLVDTESTENSLFSAVITPRGRLRVGVPSPLAHLIPMPALPASHAHYLDIQFGIGVSDRAVNLIDGNVDCALHGSEATDQSLIAHHVGDLQTGVYVAPHYVECLGVPTHP